MEVWGVDGRLRFRVKIPREKEWNSERGHSPEDKLLGGIVARGAVCVDKGNLWVAVPGRGIGLDRIIEFGAEGRVLRRLAVGGVLGCIAPAGSRVVSVLVPNGELIEIRTDIE